MGKTVQFRESGIVGGFDVRVGDLRSDVRDVCESGTGSRVVDVRDVREFGGIRDVREFGNLESESTGSRVGKTFQIDSVHEFPMLHGDVKLQKSSVDMSNALSNSVPSCNSIEVAIDKQQCNGNSNSNGNGNSNSNKTCMLGVDSSN